MTAMLRVLFRPPEDWPRDGREPGLLLEAADGADAGALAAAVADRGAASLVGWGDDPPHIHAPVVPVFDDLLALWLLRRAGPEVPASALDALTTYARLCRQGHSPGPGAPHTRPDAVLDEVRRAAGDPTGASAAERLLERTGLLFRYLVAHLVEGGSLDDDHLFEASTTFQEELELLRRDRETWLEDRARGEALTARVGERRADLFVLSRPASTRFREWARRDPTAPGGGGFALLLVEWEPGEWVLSADPARRLSIAPAAGPLDEAERAKRGGELPERWYDGARHAGTLVAAPRGGTALTREEILAALAPTLGLSPPALVELPRFPTPGPEPGAKRWAAVAWLGLCGVLLVAVLVLLRDQPSGEVTVSPTLSPSAEAALRGATRLDAEPTPAAITTGSPYSERHALIIGIGVYDDPSLNLRYAVRDARAVRDLVQQGYGFDSVSELYDAAATGEAIKDALSSFGRLPEGAALFVFWAGHGTTLTTGRGEPIGYLLPHDGRMAEGAGDRPPGGISMTEIRELMDVVVGARHKLMVVDACYGGLLATRDASAVPEVDAAYLRSIVEEPVFQVLTAGQADQAVLDGGPGGHSVFTGELLAALEPEPGRFITGRELGVEVTRAVSEAAQARGHVQTPDFGRVSGTGDFVFFGGTVSSEGGAR